MSNNSMNLYIKYSIIFLIISVLFFLVSFVYDIVFINASWTSFFQLIFYTPLCSIIAGIMSSYYIYKLSKHNNESKKNIFPTSIVLILIYIFLSLFLLLIFSPSENFQQIILDPVYAGRIVVFIFFQWVIYLMYSKTKIDKTQV